MNLSADGQRLILRHDSYAELPIWDGESELLFSDALPQVAAYERSIKVDFTVGGPWIASILSVLDPFAIPQERLWFNGDLDLLDSRWIAKLSGRYPGSVVQLPIHSVIDLERSPVDILQALEGLALQGVNRWSVGWHYPHQDRLLEALMARGYEYNIYGVVDLSEFLDSLAMQPTSVTVDFNFPEWGLHRHGSGHGGLFQTF